MSDHNIWSDAWEEPGEDWSWCFVDELMMRIPEVRGEPRIPPSPLGG